MAYMYININSFTVTTVGCILSSVELVYYLICQTIRCASELALDITSWGSVILVMPLSLEITNLVELRRQWESGNWVTGSLALQPYFFGVKLGEIRLHEN